MEVPSPIQEESGTTGTPTSRGTGTTASSTSRRQERPEEDLSRFSPMGAAVRHPPPPHGLTPVEEASMEDVGSSRGETGLPGGDGGATALRVLPSLELAGSPGFRYSIDVSPPLVSPSWQVTVMWQIPGTGTCRVERGGGALSGHAQVFLISTDFRGQQTPSTSVQPPFFGAMKSIRGIFADRYSTPIQTRIRGA